MHAKTNIFADDFINENAVKKLKTYIETEAYKNNFFFIHSCNSTFENYSATLR